VVGRGSRAQWLHQQARERRLTNIHLPGHFPVEAMPAMMARASALLVTLTDQPIFAMTVPAKVQSYLAVGRPIIACLNGEGARLVREANAGLAVAAEDARGLADAVLRLARMPPEERAQLGKNGRAYFDSHFDSDKLMTQLIDLLAGAIAAHGAKR